MLKKESPTHHPSRTLAPSPPFILPPTPPLPREALGRGSDGSPPLMLSCMNVKSLQASSTHPRRGDTSRGILDERAYFSPPSSHSPRFLVSLFSSCPPSLGSPEVSPLTDPLYVRGRKRENTNVGFRRIKKKTDGCSTSLNICSFSAGDSNSLLLFLFLCCS